MRDCRSITAGAALYRAMVSSVIEGWIPQLARRVFRLPPPATVLPEILFWKFSHPSLENLGKANDNRIDILFTISGFRGFDRLDDHTVFPVGLSNRVDKEYGCVESQGEYRGAARGLCRTTVEARPFTP